MLRLSTITHLIGQGYRITAHCGVCQHSSVLDLAALAEKLGADFIAIGDPNPLAAKLRCDQCQSKDIGLILSPVDTPKPGLGLYGRQAP